MMEVLDRHERIALSFSGGKDSTACVWLLRDHLERITLYHLDTGDLLPEVVEVVEQVRAIVPHFVTVRSDVAGWIERNGPPSDLVPHGSHPVGQHMAEGRAIVHRYSCCSANLMVPLFDRIVADGNTLLIRGTKAADMKRLPMGSGDVIDGLELLLPLLEWSNADVLAYLREQGAPISTAYGHFDNLPECATCSAWWSEGRAAYLRARHPALFAKYQARMDVVMAEVGPVAQMLARELRELGHG